MKKSSFLTFCFAMIPGAGQMYLGMIKRGVSIMLLFAAITAVTGFLNLPLFAMFLPVLWFFAFFDTFNIKGMSYEEQVVYKDKFLFNLDELAGKDFMAIISKRHVLIGWGCVLFGVYMIFQNIRHTIENMLEVFFPQIRYLFNAIPTFVVALLIIILGIYLVTGGRKRKALPPADDDFTQYGGKKDE